MGFGVLIASWNVCSLRILGVGWVDCLVVGLVALGLGSMGGCYVAWCVVGFGLVG